MKGLLFLAVFSLAAPAAATPLTIHPGESWVFTVERGQPTKARRVPSSVRAARGEVKASLITGLGTSMTLTNNSPVAHTFQAQLVGVSGPVKARTCTLPANGAPTLEYWPQKATAVRIGDFRATSDPGRC